METVKKIARTNYLGVLKRYWNRAIKLFILKLFYARYYTPQHITLQTSQLLTIFIFQKIFGLNRHIKYPIHFTNKIGRGYFKIAKSSTFSLAENGGIYIQTINGVEIEEGVLIAAGTKIISANHKRGDLSKHIKTLPIKIGKNCWIGANSILLPGVTLGDNIIVGAGAVVNKNFPMNSVIAGVPAKIIKNVS